MGAIENLQKLYDKKRQEVRQLEIKLKETAAYLQALQDSLKMLNRETGTIEPETEQTLRAGTALAQARDILRLAGKPLHITELLKQMGKPADKKTRVSLSGNLAGYVRGRQIFTRPAPNTFGLIEFGSPTPPPDGVPVPEGFGKMQ